MNTIKEHILKIRTVTKQGSKEKFTGIIVPEWNKYEHKFSKDSFLVYTVAGTVEEIDDYSGVIISDTVLAPEVEEKLDNLAEFLKIEYQHQQEIEEIYAECKKKIRKTKRKVKENKPNIERSVRKLVEVQNLYTPDDFVEEVIKSVENISNYIEEFIIYDAKLHRITLKCFLDSRVFAMDNSLSGIYTNSNGQVVATEDFSNSPDFARIKRDYTNSGEYFVAGYPIKEDIGMFLIGEVPYIFRTVTIDFGGELALSQSTVKLAGLCLENTFHKVAR